MEGPLVLIAVLIVIFLFNYLVDKIVYTVLGKERAEQIIADVAAAQEEEEDDDSYHKELYDFSYHYKDHNINNPNNH